MLTNKDFSPSYFVGLATDRAARPQYSAAAAIMHSQIHPLLPVLHFKWGCVVENMIQEKVEKGGEGGGGRGGG